MRALAGALAALALTPAPAAAHVPGLDRYLAIAEQAFPGNCGPAVVQLHEVRPPTAAWFQPWDCKIAFPAQRLHRWPAEMTCHVLVHEMGHAAGYGHSADPHDVMYPYVDDAVYPPCRRFERWRGARAARGRPMLIDRDSRP